MTRYLIRPKAHSIARASALAWTDSPQEANEMKMRLQTLTGLKWQITRKKIGYDNTV